MRINRKRRTHSLLFVFAAAATMACAHSMYQSDIMLDFAGDEVKAELQVPLERLGTVLGKPINSHMLSGNSSPLTAYVMSRFHARTTDGRSFTTTLESPLTIAVVDGSPYLVAHFMLQPPASSSAETFDIEDDVVLDSLGSQVALVSIRSDWSTSVFANDPQLVGVLRSNSRSLTIDRTGASWFRGFGSIFRLGIRHIAEGTDHLLFLLTLLLPASLLVSGHRWAAAANVRHSLLQILKVVTAFTVGHSITLALAALTWVSVPSRPVEVLIAVSILISAVHALRPIFPGREAGIAAFFGLIHGLAFATTLGELGLGRWERLASILGFNLGIETMQLIVVAATMPSLLLLSRTRAYFTLRVGGAAFAGLASVGWIIERLQGRHSLVDEVVDRVADHAAWIAGGLFLVSIVLWLLRPVLDRQTSQKAPAGPALERI